VVGTATGELLLLQEAADRLGVSVYTVRRWIKEGKLRAFKPGKEYRIREADLEEFLRAREVVPKVTSRSPYEPTLNDALAEAERHNPTEYDFRAAAEIRERCDGLEAFLEEAAPTTEPDEVDRLMLTATLGIVRIIGQIAPAVAEKESARALLLPVSRRFVKLGRQVVDLARKWELPEAKTAEATSTVTDMQHWLERAS
jgi:excisionase family DNA binding protein